MALKMKKAKDFIGQTPKKLLVSLMRAISFANSYPISNLN